MAKIQAFSIMISLGIWILSPVRLPFRHARSLCGSNECHAKGNALAPVCAPPL